jgi:hypothetical protein
MKIAELFKAIGYFIVFAIVVSALSVVAWEILPIAVILGLGYLAYKAGAKEDLEKAYEGFKPTVPCCGPVETPSPKI